MKLFTDMKIDKDHLHHWFFHERARAHGSLFYCNVYSSLFFPAHAGNLLTVFIHIANIKHKHLKQCHS